MHSWFCCLALPAALATSDAVAADAEIGRRIAEARCVACHTVAPGQRPGTSQAPPFDAIARKFAQNPETLAFALRDPHPRMNVTLTRTEMEDAAAYINSLAK
ncbi:MAG: cytochrome c [Xanthobacteraceae bacterium]